MVWGGGGCRLTKGIQKEGGRERRRVTERVACLAPQLTALVKIPSLNGMRGKGAARCVQEREVLEERGSHAVGPTSCHGPDLAGGRIGAAGRRGGEDWTRCFMIRLRPLTCQRPTCRVPKLLQIACPTYLHQATRVQKHVEATWFFRPYRLFRFLN